MRKRRRLAAVAIIVILLGGGGYVAVRALSGPSLTPAQIAALQAAARVRRITASEKKAVRAAARTLAVNLPTKIHSPVPAIPAAPFTTALGAREVVGFVPYYTLSQLSPADFTDTSALCYFGIQIAKGGTLSMPTGFVDLDTAKFGDFLASAHSANDQVLLTVSAFSKSVIDSIARNPAKTALLLDSEIAPLVSTYGLQGVDLDIEGRWQVDRKGFTEFVQKFSTAFRATAPSRVILVDTFPQSASDPHDFFDLKYLSKVVNDFFVMAYGMENTNNASANSPAFSPALGLSSVQTLMQYTKFVKPSKIILGLPFYGYDFPTESARPGAMTTTPDPEAVTYSAVTGVGRTAFWDPVSETPYTVFREDNQWHQTWYDNPLSIALKVALSTEFHTAGTGVWALGMEGGDQQMLDALDGGSPPSKPGLVPAGTSG